MHKFALVVTGTFESIQGAHARVQSLPPSWKREHLLQQLEDAESSLNLLDLDLEEQYPLTGAPAGDSL
jgi:hypothetical protein